MGYTLEQLSSTCRDILTADRGPEGRKQVCAVIRDVLLDTAFTQTYLVDGGPERKILYEDPELGFCILAHVHQGAKESQPHDHGPSWAIYGQAQGKTVMSDWAMVEAASEDKPGKVRHVRSYTLEPGMAHVYNEGDLHSPRRDGPTRLIRVEGQNMDHVRRLRYVEADWNALASVELRDGRNWHWYRRLDRVGNVDSFRWPAQRMLVLSQSFICRVRADLHALS